MRTFYIFEINPEFATLLKDSPYNLFKSMESIYYTNKQNIYSAFNIYEQLVHPLDKKLLNQQIYDSHKDSDIYTKFNNTHMINNFYNDEQTKLTINSSFILLKSNINRPSFFDDLKQNNNLFICDFENQDYFWLQAITLETCH